MIRNRMILSPFGFSLQMRRSGNVPDLIETKYFDGIMRPAVMTQTGHSIPSTTTVLQLVQLLHLQK
ncbi:hypothetical protein [Bradyrhizobium sp. Leo121]|uniref:hypothetical protein n=1 Tax=Bradyrhizobium sp. Leo121 TaxID=1571195 RepID=UPI0010290434|nr:hypothetical protein [Bradyrhizobium sp. Leo121]